MLVITYMNIIITVLTHILEYNDTNAMYDNYIQKNANNRQKMQITVKTICKIITQSYHRKVT